MSLFGRNDATGSPAESLNRVRWTPDGRGGHVESLFLKLHLPGPASFWVRYSLRRPVPGGGEPIGTLWAVLQPAAGPAVAATETFSADRVATARDRFWLRIGPGELSMGRATGRIETPSGPIAWDLAFPPGAPCVAHLPSLALYDLPLPRNKMASPHVLTRFSGTIRAGSNDYRVQGAPGMQGHNWGTSVAERWAWCHATGFAGEDGAVFDAISASPSAGPLRMPDLVAAYVRLRGREILFNRPDRMVLARSAIEGLSWSLSTSQGGVSLDAVVRADPARTIGLDYVGSSGETVRVHNSNLASASVRVRGLAGAGEVVLKTDSCATLELAGAHATTDVSVLLRA